MQWILAILGIGLSLFIVGAVWVVGNGDDAHRKRDAARGRTHED